MESEAADVNWRFMNALRLRQSVQGIPNIVLGGNEFRT